MAPDLNSLPPSRSSSSPTASRTAMPSSAEDTATAGSPRSGSTSLQQAAAFNAHGASRRSSSSSMTRIRDPSLISQRRRSNVVVNLQHYDPNVPGPGEMVHEAQSPSHEMASLRMLGGSSITSTGDPHHFRSPSLGEIHQELEQEQEAQVNRLLQQIRVQQAQLHTLQSASGQIPATSAAIDDTTTPTSERSRSSSYVQLPPMVQATRSPTLSARSSQAPVRSSFDLTRPEFNRSRTPSRTASPRVRATSITGEAAETWNLPPRDESAFYQAETQMLTRENQMLRIRIRELERQANDNNLHSPVTREPTRPSNLVTARSHSISEDEVSSTQRNVPAGGEAPKEE